LQCIAILLVVHDSTYCNITGGFFPKLSSTGVCVSLECLCRILFPCKVLYG
jgi:hypothetical protein